MAPSFRNKPWRDLNERQQKYLLAIYTIDQKNEEIEKRWASKTWRSRPADEWRWIKYGYDEYGNPTPLLAAIQKLRMVDQGTGSTFEALEIRGLIVMKHNTGIIKDIPWVRMTPKGRKLVRSATQEQRPKRLPPGTLREWHWRALVKVYEAHLNGDVGVGSKWGLGDYGGISWNTWLRLKFYKDSQLITEHEVRGNDAFDVQYYIRITDFGIQFYNTEWSRYRELYPDVEAPKP